MPDSARNARWAAALAVLVILAAPSAHAGHEALLEPSEHQDVGFDFNESTPARHHVTESLSFGAQAELEVSNEVNFDLDRDDHEDVLEFRPKVEFSVAFDPGTRLRFFGEFDVGRKFIERDPDGNDAELEVRIQQARATYADENFAVTLGRQDVSDEREWLFDEELDGVRFVYGDDDLRLAAAWWRKQLLPKELDGDHDDDEPDIFYFRAYAPIGDDSRVEAYLLGQRGRRRNRGDDLMFLGVASYGELGSNIDYWAEAAVVAGSENGRQIRGWVFDVGGFKTFRDLPGRPWAGASLAVASGDDGRGTDTAFRQTGLQDNTERAGGVTGYKFYGELLDPELSNLIIPSVVVGVRPTPDSSFDLVWHGYFQYPSQDELRDASLDEDPSGRNRYLGQEIDLIVGVRASDHLGVELIGGVFLPGPAFDDDNDPAFFFESTITLRL